jgi:exodeoxyribonuclease-3
MSPSLRDRLTDAGVDRDVRGREGASDHAPVWIRLSRGRGALKMMLPYAGASV